MTRFAFSTFLAASALAGCALPDEQVTTPKTLAASALLPALDADGSVRVIVGVRSGARDRLGHARSHLKSFASLPFQVLRVDAAELDELVADPEVLSIESDTLASPSLAESTTVVGAKTAWAAGTTGEGWAVAVLDTGVMKTHAHLAGKVIAEACYSTADSINGSVSLCPGGVSSTTASGSAVNCTGAAGCDHGTHVAAIATSAHATYRGVAPSAHVVAMQVFSQFSSTALCGSSSPCVLAYSSDWLEGLERVLALSQSGTKIAAVNLSLGGGMHTGACDASYPSMKTAIDTLAAAGIATVIAAGNEGYTNAVAFPGCISSAITVGATTKSDVVASYSNVSSQVDVLAPGSSITAAIASSTTATGGKSGTSMAAPHVAGSFALMRQANPTMTVAHGLAALQGTGTAITDARVGGVITKPRIAIASAIGSMAAPPPCTRAAPAITVTQPARVATPQLVRYSVVVTNRDASPCSAQTFDVGATAPAGWTVTSTSAALAAGASTTVNVDVTPPASAMAGATVTFTATNAMMSAYTASTTASYTLDCGRADPDLAVGTAGPLVVGVSVTNHDDAACGATSTYRMTVTTELDLSPKVGDIVVDNAGERSAGLSIGTNAEGAYLVRVTLADASGATVAEAETMIEIGADGTTTTSSGGLPDLDLACRSTRPSGLGVLLAFAVVLRRRRRRG